MGNQLSAAKVCIIGAGPAGLSAARALRAVGIDYDQFERHSDVGGIWDLDNPGTPMYESAHFISSRSTSGFFDFPMPDSFADYPSNRQILAYTRSFAETYGLRDAISFGTAVTSVEKDGDGWRVRTSAGHDEKYRAVICATGVTWSPSQPVHPGRFDGETRHSVTYRSSEEFRGKRVLVVGLGNSGADIACDAAATADAAFVSVRRGYHIIPKHAFGKPVDELAASGPDLPLRLERPLLAGLLRMLNGDLTRLGLPKPDHKLFESHPLLNSQLIHHLQHGDVAIKPDIARLDGSRVVFTDGTSEEIDLVLYATGYTWQMPYLDGKYFEWDAGRPKSYLTAFNREHPNLFTVGMLETNSSAYTLFDQITHVIAQHLRDQDVRPEAAAAFQRKIRWDDPDLTGGIKFLGSDRHRSYIDNKAFRSYLARTRKEFGWNDLAPGAFGALTRAGK